MFWDPGGVDAPRLWDRWFWCGDIMFYGELEWPSHCERLLPEFWETLRE